ncbi:DNA replication and repair protein RecN [Volucribacter psittacicida]|uniref:DNA repair protein RecN n=2 Tax=Volucribacter psittacicida TaxID=203482 RepID=A0A4R1G208_9PAST|nr:DNA repair protein RecN [Volucribacter psittacicida]TCK01598.1 DNA replication and repair protein RecN [Volucribacter psittacicida]
MLTQLTINNFAIVRQLNTEFQAGMSAITGETGAGKSIGIDALGLCLGNRTEITMLRNENERAEVTASFSIQANSQAALWLKQYDLQDQDNPTECILRRIINTDGRSKAFINNTPVPVSQLKEIGQYLTQINGQHSSQQLLKPDYQLQLLDHFCGHSSLLQQVQQDYQQWKTLQAELQQLQQQRAEHEARKQLLQYQVNELDDFNLLEGEYEELEADHKRLSNSEELTRLSQSLAMLLSENDSVNIDSMLYRATQYLSELASLDERYQSIENMLQEALIQVQEASSEISHLSNDLEQDPELLQHIEQRMGQAIQLARKHYVQPENLTQHHQQLKQELEKLGDFSDQEQQLQAQVKQTYDTLLTNAEKLYQSRCQGASKLAQQVTKSIKHLAMENAEFFIEVNHHASKISQKGADSIMFTLRSNLGQPIQPLAKIASGGELSRIALAIQVLTADNSSIPTLIFDEIDVGISGATASVVGKLLRKLGEKCQVICVTHLPQVASHAHQQFSVEKSVVDEKTETKMTALSSSQRVKALARLLAGSKKISDSALANAQEMLNLVA